MPADSFIDEDHPLMRDAQGRTIILAEDFELPPLNPRQKVKAFVAGMVDNATDLVSFRIDPETCAIVGEHEEAIWKAMNALQMVATSIQIEKQTPKIRVVK